MPVARVMWHPVLPVHYLWEQNAFAQQEFRACFRWVFIAAVQGFVHVSPESFFCVVQKNTKKTH